MSIKKLLICGVLSAMMLFAAGCTESSGKGSESTTDGSSASQNDQSSQQDDTSGAKDGSDTDSAVQASELRFDGLYISAMTDYTFYLRFFSDGKVVSISSNETAEAAWQKLTPDYDSIAGTYTVDGDKVDFDLISANGKVTYSGVISGEKIAFKTHSYINNKSFEREYTFQKINL